MFEGARNLKVRSFEGLRTLRLLRVAVVVLPLAGCASAQAKGKPADRPALNVPAPPPRIIEPAVEAPPEPVAELPPVPAASRSPRPSPRPAASEARPEPKASDAAAKPVDPPAIEPTAPGAPAAQLRTPQTADTSGAAKNVRGTIDAAQRLLNTVSFGALSIERKKAYNDAKLFIQQAEAALKEGNFAFAQAVANKAETLARELAGK